MAVECSRKRGRVRLGCAWCRRRSQSLFRWIDTERLAESLGGVLVCVCVALPAPARNLPLPGSRAQQRSPAKVDPGLSVVQPSFDNRLLVDSLRWGSTTAATRPNFASQSSLARDCSSGTACGKQTKEQKRSRCIAQCYTAETSNACRGGGGGGSGGSGRGDNHTDGPAAQSGHGIIVCSCVWDDGQRDAITHKMVMVVMAMARR